ncbi:MAG: hypothetical protein FWB91_02985 [Defluviitaleaceae bacterium]|nr:hypothetical protein [Defluviitaleaceae bacterium]
MSWRIAGAFVIVNLALVTLVFFLLMPAAESISNGRQVVRAQESRYAIESGFLAEYEANLLELAALGQRQRLLTYDEFASVLAEIGLLAASRNLTRLDLRASEPTVYYAAAADFDRLFEMRVHAVYEGGIYDALRFVYDLKTWGKVLTFSIHAEDAPVRLDVEFSVFGR